MTTILLMIGRFVLVQLLQALISVQMVKDSVLEVLKLIATHTKNQWDDKIYSRVKFYFEEDKSEHLKLPESSVKDPENENK